MRFLNLSPSDIEDLAARFVDHATAATADIDPEAPDFIAQAGQIMLAINQVVGLTAAFTEAASAVRYAVGLAMAEDGMDSVKVGAGSFYISQPYPTAYVGKAAELQVALDANPEAAAIIRPFLKWGQGGGTVGFKGKK